MYREYCTVHKNQLDQSNNGIFLLTRAAAKQFNPFIVNGIKYKAFTVYTRPNHNNYNGSA